MDLGKGFFGRSGGATVVDDANRSAAQLRCVQHGPSLRLSTQSRNRLTWLYPLIVGSWTGSLKYMDAEGNRQETTAEVHFGCGITRDSFHWINRDSADNGETWKVRGQFFLQRRAAG